MPRHNECSGDEKRINDQGQHRRCYQRLPFPPPWAGNKTTGHSNGPRSTIDIHNAQHQWELKPCALEFDRVVFRPDEARDEDRVDGRAELHEPDGVVEGAGFAVVEVEELR